MKRAFLILAAMVFFILAAAGSAQAGFVSQDGKKYYYNSQGQKVTGWLKRGRKYYYLDPDDDGAAAVGLAKIGKRSYFFRKNGVRYTARFVKDSANQATYYASKKGGVLLRGLRKINGRYYYFDRNTCQMQTGWVKTSKATYYMRGRGSLRGSAVTGWFNLDGKRYYFDKRGRMTKGLVTIDGRKYYFNAATGAMMTGSITLKGETYNFTRNGIAANPTGPWKIKVNQTTCTVTVYRGSTPVKAFACSVGLGGATPDGTFSIKDHLRWHELMGPSWGQWCSHITSSILFHSIPYSAPNDKYSMSTRGYNLLGQPASHGCVRLAASSAKYIYDNVPIGTPVVIFHGSSKDDPLGKPMTPYVGSWTHTYDPTDPTV